MQLLEGVVGEDRGIGLLGHSGDEGVAATDRTRGRGDDLAGEHRLLVGVALGRLDAVLERGVDDDGDLRAGVLLEEGPHGLVQLGEAREGPALGGDVGPIDDDVITDGAGRGHDV